MFRPGTKNISSKLAIATHCNLFGMGYTGLKLQVCPLKIEPKFALKRKYHLLTIGSFRGFNSDVSFRDGSVIAFSSRVTLMKSPIVLGANPITGEIVAETNCYT